MAGKKSKLKTILIMQEQLNSKKEIRRDYYIVLVLALWFCELKNNGEIIWCDKN